MSQVSWTEEGVINDKTVSVWKAVDNKFEQRKNIIKKAQEEGRDPREAIKEWEKTL